tara:strand:+ start:146 stop:382 length:237 start_codon:yes stop_codon:yes gene_type:complete
MNIAEDFQVLLGKLEALKRLGKLTPENAQKLLRDERDIVESGDTTPSDSPVEEDAAKHSPEQKQGPPLSQETDVVPSD